MFRNHRQSAFLVSHGLFYFFVQICEHIDVYSYQYVFSLILLFPSFRSLGYALHEIDVRSLLEHRAR